MDTITLTADQQSALESFTSFLLDPTAPVFVLSGYSGTGKSTLTKHIIDQYPKLIKVARLLNNKIKELEVVLTATTNKAAESLGSLTGMGVQTIHSYLGLRVEKNYSTNSTSLVSHNKDPKREKLIFIDEASYIDRNLLDLIFKQTRDCKIIFMGDPAQLTPVRSSSTPVFAANFPGAHLSQVVRQAEGNPIIELSTLFRETVNSGEFFSFKPDGVHIQHMNRDSFNDAIEIEFNRPDWHYQDSKVLAWTNKTVIYYNHEIRDSVKGDPNFQVGDYAICNKFVTVNGASLKTDQLVQITSISPSEINSGVLGKYFTIDNRHTLFSATHLKDKNARIKLARTMEEYAILSMIEDYWIDLRAAYACTVNKAQGSTFDRVFIDLDDISRCNSGDQIARMLYVAVSRARHQVILTGDLVS